MALYDHTLGLEVARKLCSLLLRTGKVMKRNCTFKFCLFFGVMSMF